MHKRGSLTQFSTRTLLWTGERSSSALAHSLSSNALVRSLIIVDKAHDTLTMRRRLQKLFGPQALLCSSAFDSKQLISAFAEHQADSYVVIGSDSTLTAVSEAFAPTASIAAGFLPITLRALPQQSLPRVAIDPRLTALGDSCDLIPLACGALFDLITAFFEQDNLINESHVVAAWNLLSEILDADNLLEVAPEVICGAFIAKICANNRGITAHTQLVKALSIDSWLDDYAIQGVLSLYLLRQAQEEKQSRYFELCMALEPIEPLQFMTELLERAQLGAQLELLTKLFQQGTNLLQNNQVRAQLLPLFHYIQRQQHPRGVQ